MDRLRRRGEVVRALGLMSGTSIDGVDAAIVETDGARIHRFGDTGYRPYSAAERAVLAAALGKWSGAEVDAAADVVQAAHLELIETMPRADLIGFHGQTLAHAPRTRGTLQVGDGAAMAQRAGVPVVWDFRSADVALGGEGAPLAPFFHFACAGWARATLPMVFLNLGGVGNLTWVDPRAPAPDADGALLAFDTGPANAPIDDAVAARLGQRYDDGGALARTGQVDRGVIEALLARRYFSRMPPKSLDSNEFSDLSDLCAKLSDADAVATLTAAAAACVAAGMEFAPQPPNLVLVTGGGRHNAVLMQMLAAGLDCPVHPVEDAGLDGDMLEAQAFAYLAVRVAKGLATSCPSTTGVRIPTGGGTLSVPQA